MADHDYAIVGGGLQAGLIALAVRASQPRARIAIVERGEVLAGNHTWCFHSADVAWPWAQPLVTVTWPAYDVAFPRLQRTLAAPYACVTSERLAMCAGGVVDTLWLGEPAIAIEEHRVATPTRELTAHAVIDARGPTRVREVRAGWQTFVGQEVIVRDHRVARPILMDATVAQDGAYRFMYVLPLDGERLLVEDTAFADSSYLDVEQRRAVIAEYAAARGWRIESVVREETGILPLPLVVTAPSPAAPLVAGYAGGWFHPVTGYSFPIAARLANLIASLPARELYGRALAAHASAHAAQLAFAARLNRMLFGWFPPGERRNVLERFYRLPEPTIQRFYALELTALDRARFFLGRPPRGIAWRAALGLESAR